MKQKNTGRIIAIILAVLLLAAALFMLYRWYEVKRLENMHRAIREAWSVTQDENTPEYLQYIDYWTDFGITDIRKGEPYVVTVTVHGKDLGGRLRQLSLEDFPTDPDPEVLNAYLLEQAKEAEFVAFTAQVYAWKEEDGWRIQFTETFVDAMSGGVYSYARDLADEITGGSQ